MKRTLTLIISVVMLTAPVTIPLLLSGCGTTAQTRGYNTIYALQKTTLAAYDSYLGEVIKGTVPTNGVPKISDAFNTFQLSTLVELDAVAWNTNAPATAQLETLSLDLLNLIGKFSTK